MGVRPSALFDIAAFALALAVLNQLRKWCREHPSARFRVATNVILATSAAWVAIAIVLVPQRISKYPPNLLVTWTHAGAIALAAWSFAAFLLVAFWRMVPPFDPQRRRLLATVRNATFTVPAAVTAAAFLQREDLTFREVTIPIPNLPDDLDGLRIVQVSDIHLSPFVSERLLARAIGMANETKANIALVTGDLISRKGDPLDVCFKHLKRLKADLPPLGCLGNHEIYADSEDYTTEEGKRLGITFLRHQNRVLRFGNARINFAGVDYQRRAKTYLQGAEELLVPDALNVMLSHNPDVFPVAAKKGFALTIAGHTHGGQVNVEILHQGINIARFFTPYVDGLYTEGQSSIFVTRGIGTVGLPARLGAPPEIALIRLCAT